MEYFLIFDVPGALHANPLYGQIEKGNGLRCDVVVVDAGPQEFSSARAHGLQLEGLRTRAQSQARRASPVHHAYDESVAPAVVEELFDGVAQQTRLPETAEYMLKFRETPYENRTIDRSA